MLLFKVLWQVYLDCMCERMFVDVGMARCGGWEDAYFKQQVGVEYGW